MSARSLVPTVEDYTSSDGDNPSDHETLDVPATRGHGKAPLDSPSPAGYDLNKSEHIGSDASSSERAAKALETANLSEVVNLISAETKAGSDNVIVPMGVQDADNASKELQEVDHEGSENPIESIVVPSTSTTTLARARIPASASGDEEDLYDELLDAFSNDAFSSKLPGKGPAIVDIANSRANDVDESAQVSQTDTVDSAFVPEAGLVLDNKSTGEKDALVRNSASMHPNERGATNEAQGRSISRERIRPADRLDAPFSQYLDDTGVGEKNNPELDIKNNAPHATDIAPVRLNERLVLSGHGLTISSGGINKAIIPLNDNNGVSISLHDNKLSISVNNDNELSVSANNNVYLEINSLQVGSASNERGERRLSRESVHSRERRRSVRPHSPPSRPQSYYGPPPSFQHKSARRSRPSSVVSAGSIDSGFGEGDFDVPSHRRNSRISQPPTNYHYTAPPAYTHNPYYPTYLATTPYYSTPLGHSSNSLSSIPQSARLPLPSSNPTVGYLPTPLSSISPGSQTWTSALTLPSPVVEPHDMSKRPDYEKCLKMFQDADFHFMFELTARELRASITELKTLSKKTVENLVRLFAVRNFAKVSNPPLNFEEFYSLWRTFQKWKSVFETADSHKEGIITLEGFRIVISNYTGLGYQLTPVMLEEFLMTFNQHGNGISGLDIDHFMNACIGLKRVTNSFNRWEQEHTGQVLFSLEKYAVDVLQFHTEMSMDQSSNEKATESDRHEATDSIVLSSVPQHMIASKPLPTVLEVNSPAEAPPQLKDFEQPTSPVELPLQLFSDHSRWKEELTSNNWKRLLPHLPEDFRDQLELRAVFGSGLIWTFTASDHIQTTNIPLTIAGRPVVLPVEYRYPLMSATIPPPDPHPRFIDPSTSIDEATVNAIFNTYEFALGFYLLINGMLQIIVPEDFDFQYAVSHQPNEFGGLKVSYINQNTIPTAELSAESSNATVTIPPASPIQSQPYASTVGSSKTNFTLRTNQSATPTRLELGSLVQAKVEKSKATERFQGKIGVMTTSDDGYFLVVSTHVLTQALTAAKHDSFPGPDWTKSVTVLSGNGGKEIGKISSTFDPQARAFPHGFLHDVSLVDVTYAPMHLVSGIKSPLPAHWLSQAGWSNIKYTTQTLFLLDSPDVQSKSIGILGSQCQMVGQGIFRLHSQLEKKTRFKFSFGHKRSNSTSFTSTPETWTSLVSRSVLYRVDPDFRSPGAHSGTAVCVHEESEDEVGVVKIAGFSSYAQQVSDIQRFDMEGKKFYNRLEEGRVAFYGALQAPEKLRDEHVIA